jgi:hypothetical protein
VARYVYTFDAAGTCTCCLSIGDRPFTLESLALCDSIARKLSAQTLAMRNARTQHRSRSPRSLYAPAHTFVESGALKRKVAGADGVRHSSRIYGLHASEVFLGSVDATIGIANLETHRVLDHTANPRSTIASAIC